jgi:hypothetical protein
MLYDHEAYGSVSILHTRSGQTDRQCYTIICPIKDRCIKIVSLIQKLWPWLKIFKTMANSKVKAISLNFGDTRKVLIKRDTL